MAPKYSREASTRIKEIRQHFEDCLRAIAEKLADHSHDEHVLTNHVTEAHEVLRKSGLRRPVWYRRTECEFGAGAMLIGLTPTLWNELHLALGLIVGAVGLFLAIHGWLRS